MPQASQNAGDSSKKYSFSVSSGRRNPLAIGMRPNDMKGAMAESANAAARGPRANDLSLGYWIIPQTEDETIALFRFVALPEPVAEPQGTRNG